MKGYLLLALVGVVSSAPQNWPYRDSLMPYRYGYPQSQFKYLPQIEDDEEVGPYPAGLGRQDYAVVGSDGDRARPTTEAAVVSVVETGSVAPVVEPSREPPRTTSAPSPPPPKPVGPEQTVGKPVQPPPFPPARPPPTPPPKEEEEDEDEDEEDDDESEEADDEEAEDEDKADKDEDEEEEEERRRQEPLSEEKVDEPADPVPVEAVSSSPPVVEKVVQPTKATQVEPSSVEEVNAPPPAVESNEVPTKPSEAEDESEEEGGLEDEVEALVPGYVTDQGEVLVPVDTVTGDQPISIVPDPYTPPRRGVPISGSSHFRYNSYTNPFYYADEYELARQESEESVEEPSEPKEQGGDDEDNSNEAVPEGRNEFLTSFPPSRTPALYAVINSRFPPESQEVEAYESGSSHGQHFGPVVAYRLKQTTQRPSVSVAVALSDGNPTQTTHKQVVRNPFFPLYSQQVRNKPNVGQYPNIGQYSNIGQYFRNPYQPVYQPVRRNPYFGPYAHHPYGMFQKRYPNPYIGQHLRNPYGNPYSQNTYVNRFVNRPTYNQYEFSGPYAPQPIRAPFYGQGPVRRPFYPGPSSFGSYGPRPVLGPQGLTNVKPVYLNRRPTVKPVSVSNKVVVVPKKPVVVKHKKPTPVVLQDDTPYTFEDPQAYSAESNESNQSDFVQELHPGTQVHKSRRAAKMAKKVTKKEKPAEKVKKVAHPDPLQILKKVSSKKH